MKVGPELGMFVVVSILVFAGIFALIVGYGKKLTDEQNAKNGSNRSLKC